LYAAGEIALVVIGILIALQINNWNEGRELEIKASVYTEKLMNDLIEDTLNINSLLNRFKLNKKNIEEYFEYFKSYEGTIDELTNHASRVPWLLSRYIPVNSTFVEMQSTGNLNLLQEDQRKALIELSSQQEFMQIIMESLIRDYFVEKAESRKYLDLDMSETNIYEVFSIKNNQESLLKGLKHRHNEFTILYNLSNTFILQAEKLIDKSHEVLDLLGSKK